MASNIHRIELPLGIMFPTVNCYIIPGAQLTLIDCGFRTEEAWDVFQLKLKELGYQVADIEQVIITHEHEDHIGLLSLILAHSDAVIRAPKMIEEWFKQPHVINKRYQEFTKNIISTLGLPKEKLQQSYQYLEYAKAVDPVSEMNRFEFYEAGDTLRFGERDWEVLSTPGHCLSQMVFHQQEENWLLGSDMLLPITPMPIIEPVPDQPGKSTRALKLLLHSFDRLKTFDIQLVYPGHGPAFPNANEVIDRQLTRIQMRKEECFDKIVAGAATPFEICQQMYPHQIIPPDFSGLMMILGYTDLLEEEGRVSRRVDEIGQLFFSFRS
ncbi:MAG: MBL fold metallo-hydrolase [Bacteroidota bacterium]